MSVKKYCYCENNCRYETLSKEEIFAAIMQAVETGTIGDCDTGFITTIQTITGQPLKFFVGEQSEYEKLSDNLKKNLFAIITNDTTKDSLLSTIEELKKRVEDSIPLIAQYTIQIKENYDDVTINYNWSFGVEKFNRPPVVDDVFNCSVRTLDGILFNMTARVTGFSEDGKNVVFSAIEIQPITKVRTAESAFVAYRDKYEREITSTYAQTADLKEGNLKPKISLSAEGAAKLDTSEKFYSLDDNGNLEIKLDSHSLYLINVYLMPGYSNVTPLMLFIGDTSNYSCYHSSLSLLGDSYVNYREIVFCRYETVEEKLYFKSCIKKPTDTEESERSFTGNIGITKLATVF